MKILLYISDFFIPFIFFYIVLYGILAKINIFDEFIKGVKEGLLIVFKITPTLIGLIICVGIFRTSGALDMVSNIIAPVVEFIGIPKAIVAPSIIKIFSSSAATGLVLDIFKQYGPDSLEGTMISIIMSCTETIFYTMSVYFMAVNIKKTRWTFMGALISTISGIIVSIIITFIII